VCAAALVATFSNSRPILVVVVVVGLSAKFFHGYNAGIIVVLDSAVVCLFQWRSQNFSDREASREPMSEHIANEKFLSLLCLFLDISRGIGASFVLPKF